MLLAYRRADTHLAEEAGRRQRRRVGERATATHECESQRLRRRRNPSFWVAIDGAGVWTLGSTGNADEQMVRAAGDHCKAGGHSDARDRRGARGTAAVEHDATR